MPRKNNLELWEVMNQLPIVLQPILCKGWKGWM